tara:strand:+ start:189 stop:365 length:177 start_codon:yes stop_codon:yes gene_type:complete
MKKYSEELPGSENVLDQINGPANRYLPAWVAREGTDIKLKRTVKKKAKRVVNEKRTQK